MDDSLREINVQIMDADLQRLASSFYCGNQQIDGFIRSSLALDDGFGKTFVLLSDDKQTIVGFFNIAAGSVDQVDNYGRTKMGSAIHINELAVHIKYQGLKLENNIRPSDVLLEYCLFIVNYIRQNLLGCSFVTLQATDAGKSLYDRHGFFELESDMQVTKIVDKEYGCTPMYLPLDME